MLSGEKQIEKKAESIDVGCGGDNSASDLLWSSELRSECAGPFGREMSSYRDVGLFRKQFGDAEIEQLDLTGITDQNVRWFDVTVDNQICVSTRNGTQNVEKEADAVDDREFVLIAILGNRTSLYVFKY